MAKSDMASQAESITSSTLGLVSSCLDTLSSTNTTNKVTQNRVLQRALSALDSANIASHAVSDATRRDSPMGLEIHDAYERVALMAGISAECGSSVHIHANGVTETHFARIPEGDLRTTSALSPVDGVFFDISSLASEPVAVDAFGCVGLSMWTTGKGGGGEYNGGIMGIIS